MIQKTLFALALISALHSASAQEKLTRDEALGYARAVGADAKQLTATPIATDVDVNQPVALKDEDYGGMVLPQKQLTVDAIARAEKSPVPIGQLWLHKLAPMRNGEVVSQNDLKLVTVRADGDEATVPQCALAVRRSDAGTLELLVFGKAKEPLLHVPLKAMDRAQTTPIDLDAEREGDVGKLKIRILGKYEATVPLTELIVY